MDALDSRPTFADLTPCHRGPDSPTHSPAWRWRRARWLFETGARDPRLIDDACVKRARDFLVKQSEFVTAHGEGKPARPDQVIEAAIELACDADWLKRGELEAFLLTELSIAEIAQRLDLSPEVVTTFHSLFFAVRDRPLARDWIMHKAVGCGGWNDYAGPQPVGIWKYGAFSGGALLLELLIAITADRPLPTWILEIFGERADVYERRLRLLARVAVAAMMSRCQVEIQRLLSIRAELDQHEDISGRVDKQAEMLKVMAASLTLGGRRSYSRTKFSSLLASEQSPHCPAATNRPKKPRAVHSNRSSSAPGGKHVTD